MNRVGLAIAAAVLAAPAIAVVLAAAPAIAASSGDLKVVDIKAYLFLERSGKLSPNIVGSGKAFHNTAIGEGDAGEPANSLLIDIVLTGDTKANEASASVTINRSGQNGKPVVIKKVVNSFLFDGEKKTMHKPIFLEDAVCGPLKITVKAGQSSKTASIDFTCGE